jgi:hypothetical protein
MTGRIYVDVKLKDVGNRRRGGEKWFKSLRFIKLGDVN